MYDINTIEELITVLGGDTILAKHLGVSQPCIGGWKVRQEIPPGRHMRLFAMALAEGKTVNPSVFGMSESEMGPILKIRLPVKFIRNALNKRKPALAPGR